jgi:hypothetical protein
VTERSLNNNKPPSESKEGINDRQHQRPRAVAGMRSPTVHHDLAGETYYRTKKSSTFAQKTVPFFRKKLLKNQEYALEF